MEHCDFEINDDDHEREQYNKRTTLIKVYAFKVGL